MGWWDRLTGRAMTSAPEAEQRMVSIESIYGSDPRWLEAMGVVSGGADMPVVTVDSALQFPPVSSAVTFLSRALASLPLLQYEGPEIAAKPVDDGLTSLLRDAPNPELTSFDWRRWFWERLFTSGRGLTWIERKGRSVVGLWPMDPNQARIERRGGRVQYWFAGQSDPYPAADVIDLAWMMRSDGVGHYSPVQRGAKAIAKGLAMMDYGARLFAKGGVPPLVLEGPAGTGGDAMRRALEQVNEAIKAATDAGIPMVRLPAGFTLKPIGFNPRDGQAVEADKAVMLDVARLYNLPPAFLQDLQFATFTNSEQQDLHLVKHLLRGWAEGFEQQVNLKVYGHGKTKRWFRHDLQEMMRGDFKSLMEGVAQGVNSGVMTPNDGRRRVDLPPSSEPAADQLHIQGATVPLGTPPQAPAPTVTGNNGGTSDGN